MTQLEQILLTSGLTIAGAVAVFALTQFVQRFWLDPIQEYTKAVAHIDFTLLMYANVVGTPSGQTPEARLEASRALRECAGRLQSAANSVHWWWVARLFGLTSRTEELQDVLGKLIGLSNMGGSEAHVNSGWMIEIRNTLRMRVRAK